MSALVDPNAEFLDVALTRFRDEADRYKTLARELAEALENAKDEVCSNFCPSAWHGKRPPHDSRCLKIKDVLAKARAAGLLT